MLCIGLTGGIGSGKSTVCDLFAELGVPVIDSDIIAREVVEPGTTGLQQVVEAFGADVLNPQGRLDRRRLRDMIFRDDAQRHRLEAILHPLVRAEMQRRVRLLDAPYCILCIPLLLETAQQDTVQRILVIDTTPELQLARTQARDGSDRAQVLAIIQAQVDRPTRLAAADDVISNTADLASLQRQVEKLHHFYLNLATTGD